VARRQAAIPGARDEGVHDELHHSSELVAGKRRAAEPPEVELVRLADGQPVDSVAPIDEPRAGKEHVVVGRAGERAQEAGDHRAGVRTEHLRLAHVAGVPGVARSGVGRVAQELVVVGDRHERVGSVDDRLATPGLTQRPHDVADECL
jgi:hypothetical protein